MVFRRGRVVLPKTILFLQIAFHAEYLSVVESRLPTTDPCDNVISVPIEFANAPLAGLTSLIVSRIQLNLLIVVEYAFRIESDGSIAEKDVKKSITTILNRSSTDRREFAALVI